MTVGAPVVLATLCIAGTAGVFQPGEVWTISEKETADWVDGHQDGVTDWQLRLQ